jgi:hypothetical protein
MLAILSGGELLGIPGALLAVPVVASLSVVGDEVRRERAMRHRVSGEVGTLKTSDDWLDHPSAASTATEPPPPSAGSYEPPTQGSRQEPSA